MAAAMRCRGRRRLAGALAGSGRAFLLWRHWNWGRTGRALSLRQQAAGAGCALYHGNASMAGRDGTDAARRQATE